VRITMSRPQATTAFIPISNRSSAPRPGLASSFMSVEEAARTHSWFDITAKKKAGKVTAEVMIYGEIGWEVTAKEFVRELTAIEADQINVHINSVGGDVFDGVAIYNCLRLHPADVTVVVDGIAASAASFIAQAGDEVFMLRGSEMMIHDASAFAWGNEEVMRGTADILGRISNNIADIYAQRAGGTVEDWRAIMQAEMWYSPEEAVAAGLADRALDDTDEDAVAAKNSWDLRVFNYAGRKDAPSPDEETRKIINRAKEAPVKDTKNSTEETATTTPPAPPAPPEPTPPPSPPSPPSSEVEDDDDETEAVETPPVEVPAAAAKNTVASGVALFMVNGKQVTDPSAVQAHITSLESFFNETRESNRKEFITGLAKNNKIAATQIGAMEELVATMDDKQYDLWCASWEAAPNVALLGSHGGGDGGSPSGTAQTTAADRVEVLKGIVNQHKLAGMVPEKIKDTNSYKELMQLQPEYTL
jgi:ATP-dependent protease ClpP protease subunit